MNSELDVEFNPDLFGTRPPIISLKSLSEEPRPRKRHPKFHRPFQFGEIIEPNRDLIGGYSEECARRQVCLNRDTLKSMSRFRRRRRIQTAPWKMGQWVHCRLEPRDLYRVVSTRFGWRVQHRVPSRGPWNALGHSLVDMPVLFPTADAAIAAAEILIQAPSSKFGYLIWMWPG